jgi:hypothetical protein
MDDDKELDGWLAGLSGKRPPQGALDEAATLRKVLLRQQAEADAADSGPDAGISELGRQRILQRLRAEGMELQGRPAPHRRAWAVAAALMLVALATTLALQPWESSHTEVMRGVVGGLSIVSATPDAEARRVVAELQQLGLPATPNDDDHLKIEVTTSPEQLPLFGEWMERHGGSARAAGDYEIVIEQAP